MCDHLLQQSQEMTTLPLSSHLCWSLHPGAVEGGAPQRRRQDREVVVVTLRRLRVVYQLAWRMSIFSQLVQLHWPRWATHQHYLCEHEYQCMETGSCKTGSFCGWMPERGEGGERGRGERGKGRKGERERWKATDPDDPEYV